MIWIFPLALLSGILGRMGGAEGFSKNWRRLGCSTIVVLSSGLLFGWDSSAWLAYSATFLLSWGAFCTYWDRLFGKDCHWFSGLMVGFALFPMVFVDPVYWMIVPMRAMFLAISWHMFEKLPGKILFWKRDVASEFLRYFVSL